MQKFAKICVIRYIYIYIYINNKYKIHIHTQQLNKYKTERHKHIYNCGGFYLPSCFVDFIFNI